jgi:hypothetical protein
MTRIMDRRMLVFALAVLALVLAMTSAAWAAGRNSVNSQAIVNGQVKTADLAAGAVTSGKLRDGTVRGIDLKDGAVGHKDIAESAVGAQELGTIVTVESTTGAITDADGTTNGGAVGVGATLAECPDNSRAIGGGAEWVDPSSGNVDNKNLYLHTSMRSGDGWFARGIVDFGAQGNVKLRVHVYCLLLGGPQS